MAIRMLSSLIVATALLLAPQLALAEIFDGTIVAVTEENVTLMVAEEEKSFSINDETSISLDGVLIEDLSELGMGASASISAEKQEDETWLAQSIMAETSPLYRLQ